VLARPFLIHCLSPLHAGTGEAAGVVDLPIARMRSTGIPIVPGSSIKGVLREHGRARDRERCEAVFGPSERPDEHAGALVVGDARLLALPVRSFKGAFAWATCPLLLELAARDLRHGAEVPRVPSLDGRALAVKGAPCVHEGRMVYLEELDLDCDTGEEVAAWAELLTGALQAPMLAQRLVVVDDDTMAFLWETATQVDARVRIDNESGTVAPGALWLEESLPPDTVLVGLLAADYSRRQGRQMTPAQVLDFALGSGAGELELQLGGEATIGRGRAAIVAVGSERGDG
jgi:CRISPR-associated protein Cmr4